MLTTTIGICAYNEEKNIGALIQSLLDQKTDNADIKYIVVVSSACTDKTDDIVKSFIDKDNRIRIITQKEREGKASAINMILDNTTSDIIILAGADIVTVDNTIDKLVSPFLDGNVGMTGGHPIPVDDKNTFVGYSVHLIWELHHKLALKNPKLGEIIAFRNVINKIPTDTAVDEASIEAIIREKNFVLCYVPDAIVYNKGPSTIGDFILQRRRIYAGHIHLKNVSGYKPSSMSTIEMANLIIENTPLDLKEICWTIGTVCLEICARLLGTYDFYIIKKNPYIWDMVKTSKEVNVSRKTLERS